MPFCIFTVCLEEEKFRSAFNSNFDALDLVSVVIVIVLSADFHCRKNL